MPWKTSSDVEAKHLQLSIDQVEKTPSDYIRSAQALATLAANSGETDKCSSTNTSLNSSSSSTSNRLSGNKILKSNRTIKQRKSPAKSLLKTEVLPSPTLIDDYPSATTTSIAYPHEELYYPSHHPQNSYPNFSLYPSATTYPNSTCFPPYPNLDDETNKPYSSSSSSMYNSMYYDPQQVNNYNLFSSSKIIPSSKQQQSSMGQKKKQLLPIQTSQQASTTFKRSSSSETLTMCDVNNKRLRLDNESVVSHHPLPPPPTAPHHHHHFSHSDYSSNLPSDKLDFYPSTNNCYVSSSYPNEHPYHHTSVIVDSQQYFLNGWNGATAF